MWAYGLNTNRVADADAAEVYSWEGDHPTDQQALAAARVRHGPDGDIIVAWVERLSYARLVPSIQQQIADMKERVAEAGGDTTCFDLLTEAELNALDAEIRGAVEVWEDDLVTDKKSTAVSVRNRKRYGPE